MIFRGVFGRLLEHFSIPVGEGVIAHVTRTIEVPALKLSLSIRVVRCNVSDVFYGAFTRRHGASLRKEPGFGIL